MSQAQTNPADDGAERLAGATPASSKLGNGRRWIAGIALIVVGAFALIGQNTDSELFGLLFLPGLGILFVAWGASSRKVGLIVAGGIVGGVGLGALLVETLHLEGQLAGGTVLMSMSVGWVLITVFAQVFANRQCIWPLIPGTILAIIGALLLMGANAPQMRILNNVWPVALIALGLYLLYLRWRTTT